MRGKTIKDIAEFYGLHLNTVRDWIKAGCPYVQRGFKGGGAGKEWLLDPVEVEKWKIAREVKKAVGDADLTDIEEAKRRKVAAEASLVELELMREQGLVVEIEKITSKLNDELVNFRAKMLSIPTKVVSQVYAAKSKDEIREILDSSIHEALNEISIASAEAADGFTDEEDTSDNSISHETTA